MKANLTTYKANTSDIYCVCIISLNLVILHAMMKGQSQKAKLGIMQNQSPAYSMTHCVFRDRCHLDNHIEDKARSEPPFLSQTHSWAFLTSHQEGITGPGLCPALPGPLWGSVHRRHPSDFCGHHCKWTQGTGDPSRHSPTCQGMIRVCASSGTGTDFSGCVQLPGRQAGMFYGRWRSLPLDSHQGRHGRKALQGLSAGPPAGQVHRQQEPGKPVCNLSSGHYGRYFILYLKRQWVLKLQVCK